MAWVVPVFRTTAELITAAIWNQDVVDNAVDLRRSWEKCWNVDRMQIPAASTSVKGSRFDHPVVLFDDTLVEHAFVSSVLPDTYNGNGIDIVIWWTSASTTNNVVWQTTFESHTPDTDDLDSDSYATGVVSATTDTPGSAGVLVSHTHSHTDGAQIDNLAAGESFRLRVGRVGSNGSDTLTGDVELYKLTMHEAAP